MNITDTTSKMAVLTAGVVFALAVNLVAPFTVKRFELTGLAYTVETVHVKVHHFEVGSFSGGVQWVQVGPMFLPTE